MFLAEVEKELTLSTNLDMEGLENFIKMKAEEILKITYLKKEETLDERQKIELIWMTEQLRKQISQRWEYNRMKCIRGQCGKV